MPERFAVAALEGLVRRLAEASRVPAESAAVLARALVDADVHGVGTHGVSRLGIYLKRIGLGLIEPRAQLIVERDGGSLLAFDAANGLGQVQAMRTLELLMERARSNGVAVGTIRNSQHFGALAYYCGVAAEEGMILLAMTNSESAMAPAGGYDAFFGTNPIAAAFPTGKGFHVSIDLATSVVARGKIIAAARKGEPIPEGWALDTEGDATTNAEQAMLGTVLTMAGHKGYALALMVEGFAGVLSGAGVGDGVGSMYTEFGRKQDVGHFFCVVNIAAVMELTEFRSRMDRAIDVLKTGRRRAGVEEILVPGERSARRAEESRRLGVPLERETLEELRGWCQKLGVSFTLSEIDV